MRKYEEIMAGMVSDWDGSNSMPALCVLQELSDDGRFDEITQTLVFIKRHYRHHFLFVRAQATAMIKSRWFYSHSGVDWHVIDEHWNDEGIADAVNDALLREGLLPVTVERIVERLNEIGQAKDRMA